MGGLVAYEMARHLSEAAYRVGLVASFDTHLPARQPETVNENRASDARHKENMFTRFALDMTRLLGKDVNDLREQFLELGYERQFQFVQRMLICEGMLSQSSARDEMTNLLDVFSRNSVAIDSYSLRPSTIGRSFRRGRQRRVKLSERGVGIAHGPQRRHSPGAWPPLHHAEEAQCADPGQFIGSSLCEY